MRIASRERHNVLIISTMNTAHHSLKFIAAYVLTTMAYPHGIVLMYDVTTDLANHATKIGPRCSEKKLLFIKKEAKKWQIIK